MKKYIARVFILVISLFLLIGCGGSDVPAATFTLQLSESAITVQQGAESSITVTVTGNDAFVTAAKVADLILTGAPAGVSYSFAPQQTTTESTLTIKVSASAVPGTTSLTVGGSSGSITTGSKTLNLTVEEVVVEQPSFTLSSSESSLEIVQGQEATVNISVGGNVAFTNAGKKAELTLEGNPAGVSFSFAPKQAETESVLTLKVSNTAALGTTSLTVKGTSSSIAAKSTSFDLTIKPKNTGPAPSFNLSVSPKTVTIFKGVGGNSTNTSIDISKVGGFDSPINLSVTDKPAGFTTTFGSNPVSSDTNLTVKIANSVALGNYTLKVFGTSGAISKSDTLKVEVKTLIVPALATQRVVAYAWANNDTSASYTPDSQYSYNSAGDAITARRSAKGKYSITFTNLVLSGGNVQVTSYSGQNYCNVSSWSSTTANVRCYDYFGDLVDTRYSVLFTGLSNKGSAKITAYGWANNPSTSSYDMSSNYSYTAGGGKVNVVRNATGRYTVKFNGLNDSGGNIQVSAYDSNRYCNVKSWGSSTARVECYNAAGGALADAKFTILRASKASSSSQAKVKAYAWASNSTSASYTVSGYKYNQGNGTITAKRTAKGTYSISFAGNSLGSGNIQVSAYSSETYCNVTSWGGTTAGVQCYDEKGNLTDTRYSILYISK